MLRDIADLLRKQDVRVMFSHKNQAARNQENFWCGAKNNVALQQRKGYKVFALDGPQSHPREDRQ